MSEGAVAAGIEAVDRPENDGSALGNLVRDVVEIRLPADGVPVHPAHGHRGPGCSPRLHPG